LARVYWYTDFLNCEDYPYPGHQEIFENTYLDIWDAVAGHADVLVFHVATYRHGYMALKCELSDGVSARLESKVQKILSAAQQLSGVTCTICGAKIRSRAHLRKADPTQAFCKSHTPDEKRAVFGAQVEIEKAAAELGIKLVAKRQ
jgi:hypothetical protein